MRSAAARPVASLLLLALAATAGSTNTTPKYNPNNGVPSGGDVDGSRSHLTGGVTRAFERPPAHPALDFADVRLAGSSTPGKTAAAAALISTNTDTDDVADESIPEQVHLLPRGPGEIAVVWATAHAVEPAAVVRYGRVKSAPSSSSDDDDEDNDDDEGAMTLEAAIASTAYTAQICLGEPNNIAAVMGDPTPVHIANLTFLANTSRWAPPDAANYYVVKAGEASASATYETLVYRVKCHPTTWPTSSCPSSSTSSSSSYSSSSSCSSSSSSSSSHSFSSSSSSSSSSAAVSICST